MSVALTAHMATMSATAVVASDSAPAGPELPDAILALSPTGYWKFDDASSPPQDSSGNGRHASATTNITYQNITGPDGVDYLTFTGNQKIPVADQPQWTVGASGMSFFFAMRLTSFATDRCVLCKGPSGWEVAIESLGSGEVRATTMTSAGALIKSETTGPISVLDEWAVYCVTISTNDETADLLIYKNRNVAETTTPAVGSGTVSNTASVMQLTARSDTSVNAIVGSAAHMAFFDGVLDTTEIQTLMDAAEADGWFVPASLADAIDDLSPVMWFKFNEASGDAIDYGSRGVNAADFGTNTYQDVAGPDGVDYLTFGGSSSNYFEVPDAADLGIDAATGKTFIFCYRPTSHANNLAILGKMDSTTNRDYGIFVPGSAGSTRLRGQWYQDGSSSSYSNLDSPELTPALNEWHTVIVRFNTDGTVTMWQDSNVGSSGGTPTGTPEQNGNQPLVIGTINFSFTGYYLIGAIANVAMWNTALSDTDCEALMDAAIAEGWTP